MQVLMDDELERSDEGSFERSDVHFPVALAGMAVANFKERAAGVDRKEKRRARDQILVVEVAGVYPRRIAADTPRNFRRSNAHAAEEGMQRDLDALGEMRDHPRFIQRDDFHARVGKVVGEEAAAGAESVVGVGYGEADFLDAHFEDVAGLGAFDGDRAGKNVPARSLVLDFFVDVAKRLLDAIGGKNPALHTLAAC